MRQRRLFETEGGVLDDFVPNNRSEIVYTHWQILTEVEESLGKKALKALQIEEVVEDARTAETEIRDI